MGTYGTGPMDNDDALDLLDSLTVEPLEDNRLRILREALDVHSVSMAARVGACAIIADVINGRHFYTPEPEEDDEFRLDMIHRGTLLDEGFRGLALEAMKLAWASRYEGGWTTQISEELYINKLSLLWSELLN